MKHLTTIILAIGLCATVMASGADQKRRSAPNKGRRPGLETDKHSPKHGTRPKAVDLGLSVLWADHNLGASKPSDFGNYYSWGELKPKKEYYDSLCTTWGRNFENEPIGADTLYDAATVVLKDNWRLPSAPEMQALVDSCRWEWTKMNNVNGYRVTGPSGNSIFLPAAGFMTASIVLYDGEMGYYWSDEPISTRLAGVLSFDANQYMWFSFTRSSGLPIRPVTRK